MAGRIAVVDDENNFVRWEERGTIHQEQLVHRSIHVMVFDSIGRLLIQKRHADKETYPLHWDTSCAGHVEESDYTGSPDEQLDDVYRAVAGRELDEELGVRLELEELGHFGPEPEVHYEQIRLYRASGDGPFRPQPEEVAALEFVTAAELEAFTARGEKVTSTLQYFVRWLRDNDQWS